tara:strand:- start:542 stop:988 length:447 start_codon:yes stop_codon:yes gene_type:complete
MRELTDSDHRKFGDALELVGGLCDIDSHKILRKSRDLKTSKSRHFLAYYMRMHTDLPFRLIGELMSKSHCTIIHSVSYVSNTSEYDSEYKSIKVAVDTVTSVNYSTLREDIMRNLKVSSTDESRCRYILELIKTTTDNSNEKLCATLV